MEPLNNPSQNNFDPQIIESFKPEIRKATEEAFGNFLEKIKVHEKELTRERIKAQEEQPEQPKSFFIDPYSLLAGMGLGYQAQPSGITFETLRVTSERNNIIAAIIATRLNQISSFSRIQENKYSMGFRIKPRGSNKQKLNNEEEQAVEKLQRFVLNTGLEFNLERDSFKTYLMKIGRDRLTYDAVAYEKAKTLGGGIHSFYAVPGNTIRIATPKTMRGTPSKIDEYKKKIKYVQLMHGTLVNDYTIDQLAYCVGNPRTHERVGGYGFPEIEQLMVIITAHLWAQEWNIKSFSQGSTIKGILNIQGAVPPAQLESFRRAWAAQIAGVQNAFKTPILNASGLQWMPLQLSNQEMGYQLWLEYLLKCIGAIYQIDTAEFGFDLRGGAMAQPMFMSTNEAQQKLSKDKGLEPLLTFIADEFNRHVIWQIDEKYELTFSGINAKTEEQAAQLRLQQGQNYMTVNEIRQLENLPKLKEGGDIILNPTFTGAIQQAKAMAMQQGQGGGQPNQEGGQQGMQGEPGKEEEEAGENLRQYAEGKKKVGEGDSSSSEDDWMDINDWTSTVQDSLPAPDLTKSFYLLDLE